MQEGEMDSDENHMWKLGYVLNEHILRKIASSMADSQKIYLDTVGRSELIISRTNLDSHANMVVLGRNVQIVSDTSRTA